MNPNVYRWCAVPQCGSTTIKTPNKLFVNVPMQKKVRNTWLKLARRDPAAVSINSVISFCEDHFDLPNDMENYIQYHIMGSVPKVNMKSGCIPTKFECQPDRRKRASATIERSYAIKKQKMLLIEEIEKKYFTVPSTLSENPVLHTIQEDEQAPTINPKSADKSVQVYLYYKFRSKSVQTKIKTTHQFTSPMKPVHCSVSTSPIKITRCGKPGTYLPSKPETSSLIKASRRIFITEEQCDSDIAYTPSVTRKTSPATLSLQTQSSSDCSELTEEKNKIKTTDILNFTLSKIMKNPRSYIGIISSCYYLISEETGIQTNHVLLCLQKIRLNNTFRELADNFSMSPTYASKIFFKSIPIIASVMQPFIVKLDKNLIKKTLPRAFRHKYHRTSCIIDCLEIEVQKPSKAVHQSLSWSDYKKANTIKYLVSCTPNGLVSYISPGYGGRITDTCLVETCDFVKCLQPDMCVMADRGFKHVELYLHKKNVQLVRPPSVVTGAKLSKSQVKETKQIASLRIHVERVIRRLREFNMLKPHACLNTNFIKVLDDIIVIACALINLQGSLIK